MSISEKISSAIRNRDIEQLKLLCKSVEDAFEIELILSKKILFAIRNRDIEQLKLLCESVEDASEIKIILDARFQGAPLLYSAIIDAFVCDEIVSYLIHKGANPNARSHDDYFLLHRAINHGHLKGAEALIRNGANVNIKNKNNTEGYFKNETALHFAIRKGFDYPKVKEHEKYKQILGLIQLLIEKKADVNAKDERGSTPLHLAAFYNIPEVAELLIQNGADVNIKNNTGKFPLDQAKERKDNQAMITLLENGLQSTVSGTTQKQAHGKNNGSQLEVHQQPTDATGTTKQQEISEEDVAHNSAPLEVQQQLIDNTQHSDSKLLNLSSRQWAVIGIATVTCALALYFLAPLILGANVALGTKLALGAAGAVIGCGIGYLTNIVIDKLCSNAVTLDAQ